MNTISTGFFFSFSKHNLSTLISDPKHAVQSDCGCVYWKIPVPRCNTADNESYATSRLRFDSKITLPMFGTGENNTHFATESTADLISTIKEAMWGKISRQIEIK